MDYLRKEKNINLYNYMPEGPEVKKASEYLNNYFKNNKILDIIILKGRYSKKEPQGFKEIQYPLSTPIPNALSTIPIRPLYAMLP